MEGSDGTGEGRVEKPGGKKKRLDTSRSRKLKGQGQGEGYRAQGQGSPSGSWNHSSHVWHRGGGSPPAMARATEVIQSLEEELLRE